MAGLLDYLTSPDTGNGIGGLLDYLSGPTYGLPNSNQDLIKALQQGGETGSALPPSPWAQPGTTYATPPAPSVFDTGAGNMGGWTPGVQAPPPQAALQAPPIQASPTAPPLPPPANPPAALRNIPPGTVMQAPPLSASPEPQAPQSPEPSINPSNNLMAGFQNFANAGGLLPALGGLVQGLSTGQRTDPLGMQQQSIQATYQALKQAGMPGNLAYASAMNPKLMETIAPQYFAKSETIDGGTDPFTGQKILYWKVPDKEGGFKLVSANPTSGASVSEPSLQSFRNAVNNGVSGEALYNFLPKDMGETIRAMIEGRRPAPTGMGMKNPAVQAMVNAAHQIDPDFDETTWGSRNKGRTDWTSGTSSNTSRSANQSAMHAGELVDKMQALPGHMVPAANGVQNFFNSQVMGKPAEGNFLVNAHALADELSTLWKQHNISDTEIRAWESNLSPNMSEDQQRGMMRTLYGLYTDSIKSLEQKRENAIGPAAAAKMGPLLGPDAQAALAKVKAFSEGGTASSNGLPAGWSVKVR